MTVTEEPRIEVWPFTKPAGTYRRFDKATGKELAPGKKADPIKMFDPYTRKV